MQTTEARQDPIYDFPAQHQTQSSLREGSILDAEPLNQASPASFSLAREHASQTDALCTAVVARRMNPGAGAPDRSSPYTQAPGHSLFYPQASPSVYFWRAPRSVYEDSPRYIVNNRITDELGDG